MKCHICGARLGDWTGLNSKGETQGWRRLYVVDGRGRAKCADRNSCKNRARECLR